MDAGKQLLPLLIVVVHPRTPAEFIPAEFIPALLLLSPA
jgi:hypothetical protein